VSRYSRQDQGRGRETEIPESEERRPDWLKQVDDSLISLEGAGFPLLGPLFVFIARMSRLFFTYAAGDLTRAYKNASSGPEEDRPGLSC